MDAVLEMELEKANRLMSRSADDEIIFEAGTAFETWNSFWMKKRKEAAAAGRTESQPKTKTALFVVDDLNPAVFDLHCPESADRQQSDAFSGRICQRPVKKKHLQLREMPEKPQQINVLMNTSMYDESWCYPALKKIFHASDRVCILAFSFYNDTKNLKDWQRQYGEQGGIWYRANQDPFYRFGIRPEQIVWVNYFTDSIAEMKRKISDSSILVLPGGAPDLLFLRIREKKLASLIRNYTGTIVGFSAGAMVQLEKYHITPDEDYPEYQWLKGLGLLSGFDIEVHYAATPHQKRHIEKAMQDSGLPIYAIYEKGGMILDEEGKPSFFGQVDSFEQ